MKIAIANCKGSFSDYFDIAKRVTQNVITK